MGVPRQANGSDDVCRHCLCRCYRVMEGGQRGVRELASGREHCAISTLGSHMFRFTTRNGLTLAAMTGPETLTQTHSLCRPIVFCTVMFLSLMNCTCRQRVSYKHTGFVSTNKLSLSNVLCYVTGSLLAQVSYSVCLNVELFSVDH